MVDSSIDRATIQRALRSWVIGATELDDDRVVWSPTNAPQRPRPWIWISIVGQPRATAPAERERYSQPMLERITVETAAAGPYRFRIFEGSSDEEGVAVEYIAGGGDDLEAIRDGLLAEVPAWPASGVDPEDPASLLLAGTVDPTPRHAFHVEIETGALARATVHEPLLERWRTDKALTLRVQAETDSQVFEQHAGDLLDRLDDSLALQSVRDTLRAAGLVVRQSIPQVDLSLVVDTAHVSRVSQDFIFALASRTEEERPWIRSLEPTQVTAF